MRATVVCFELCRLASAASLSLWTSCCRVSRASLSLWTSRVCLTNLVAGCASRIDTKWVRQFGQRTSGLVVLTCLHRQVRQKWASQHLSHTTGSCIVARQIGHRVASSRFSLGPGPSAFLLPALLGSPAGVCAGLALAVDPSAEAISANALGCVGGDELADDGPTLCADTVVPVSTKAPVVESLAVSASLVALNMPCYDFVGC